MHPGRVSMCLLSPVSVAGERQSSPGLELVGNVREVVPGSTSRDLWKTPHLTEDGRALPIIGRAFRRAVDCGSRRDLSASPTSEIESLREALALRKFEPHPYPVAGNKVRIDSGSLVGMVGVLVRKKNRFRVVLTLDVIMRSVAVEVGSGEIGPVKRQPPIVPFDT